MSPAPAATVSLADAQLCAVSFPRLADGALVRCILAAGHSCAHAFGEGVPSDTPGGAPRLHAPIADVQASLDDALDPQSGRQGVVDFPACSGTLLDHSVPNLSAVVAPGR